jgi:membrane-associated protease RseP (regulator of RpoE activity)
MAQRILLLAVLLLLVGGAPLPVKAENAMGYRLLSAQEATALPHNHGSLGMDVERSQEITDGGITFDIIRIKQVQRGSPSAQAGFKTGDQIIAVDGRVFPTLVSFAGYIGALSPGTQAVVDYIPVGGGPAQAQRVPVTVGVSGRSSKPNEEMTSTGLSKGTKVAIGVGAVALLGCYEMGCFSHRASAPPIASNGRLLNQPNNQPR